VRRAFTLIILCLVPALGAAVVLYQRTGRDSRPPEPPATFVPPAVEVRHPAGPVVVLGASYARDWSLQLQTAPVLNVGREGQQSWELLARLEADVLASAPRAVLIWGYINDIFRSPRASVTAASDRARESVTRMVELARAAGVEPMLATEVTIRPQDTWRERAAGVVADVLGRTSYQDYINSHVVSLNQWLRGFARREQVLLLDFEKVLAGDDGLRRLEYAREDGSHISGDGYAALTAYAAPILERRLADRAQP
jgi:lysophospholipase L1-like esterase